MVCGKRHVSHRGTAERNDAQTSNTHTAPACLGLNTETQPAVSEGSNHFNRIEAHGHTIGTTIFQEDPMIIRDTIQPQLKLNKDLSIDTSCILRTDHGDPNVPKTLQSRSGFPKSHWNKETQNFSKMCFKFNFSRESIKNILFISLNILMKTDLHFSLLKPCL